MIFLCSQPDSTYFIWQLLTLGENFRELNVNKEDIHFLVGYRDTINPEWDKWKNDIYANVHFVEDTRTRFDYSPSTYPHLIKKFLGQNEHLSNEYIFYHDSDIAFSDIPYFDGMEDGRVHLSRTTYLDHTYMVSWHSPSVLKDLIDVVGISEQTIKSFEHLTGGAQMFAKGLNYYFWNKVEEDCYKMQDVYYNNLAIYKQEYKSYCDSNGIDAREWDFQIWTISMWSTLWNLWMEGYQTVCNPILNFSWPEHNLDEWDSKYVFHNSGVKSKMEENNNFFQKMAYMQSYPIKFDYRCEENWNDGSTYKCCQYNYVKLIERTAYRYWLKQEAISYYIINTKDTDLVNLLTKYYNITNNAKQLIILNTDLSTEIINDNPTIKIINSNTNHITGNIYQNELEMVNDIAGYSTGTLCNLLI